MFKQYSGGKGQYGIYQKIINLMPPHEVYIETHLGGGAIIRIKRPAERNIGIEINSEVIKIWKNNYQADIELINDDAVNYLKKFQFTGQELIYCDPPYLRETRKNNRNLYKYDYTLKKHIELLKVIKNLPCKVMISGYESDLYKEYLNNWYSCSFQAGCHHGIGIEWIWMNFSSPVELHDYSYLGDNFRQRERIKKRINGWAAKFKTIPALEQQALLQALQAVKEG